MKLNRTKIKLDRTARNNENENWQTIEKKFNNVFNDISDDVYNKVVDDSKINWEQMVDSVSDLPNDATVGETRGVKENNKIYRFDGTEWKAIAEISLKPIVEVDTRISSQIDQITLQLADKVLHRKIYTSNDEPLQEYGEDGDIWLVYSNTPMYEQGEWIPTFVDEPSGLIYETQNGSYIRVGKLVTIFYYIQISNAGEKGPGNVRIGSLPYQNNSQMAVASSLGEVRGIHIGDGLSFSALLPGGSNIFSVRKSIDSTGSPSMGVVYDDLTNTTRIIGQFSYLID